MVSKQDIVDHLGNFLFDFHYTKIADNDIFEQGFPEGRKLVIINITPYADGVMLELLLGIQLFEVEATFHQFYQKLFSDKTVSLSFWENAASLSDLIPKRAFISSQAESNGVLEQLESILAKKGFYWLDEHASKDLLKDAIHQSILANNAIHKNIFFLSQRSLILHQLLGVSITDQLFYSYYEVLELNKVPDSQLEEFLSFRKFLEKIK